MSNIRAGIVNVAKFVSCNNKKFKSYIDYIDREEAVRNNHFKEYNLLDVTGYNEYMERPQVTGKLFTRNRDSLNQNEKKLLKKAFQQAQNNQSIMWQDVISFDNRFLEKYGLMDTETGWIDEKEIREGIRSAVQVFLENEGMAHSAVWSAAIHYNTDNIHIHIATVEPNPTRPFREFRDKKTGKIYTARRGYRKQGTLDKMKQTMLSSIIDRSQERQKLSELIRIHSTIQNKKFKELNNHRLMKLYENIRQKLPPDRRLWKYNMNAIESIKPDINQFIDVFLNTYKPEMKKEFIEKLEQEVQFVVESYGEGTKEVSRAQEYKKNKMHELYSKVGNTLLKEMREERRDSSVKNKSKQVQSFSFFQQMKRLNRAIDREFNSKRNQHIHQKIQEEQDR